MQYMVDITKSNRNEYKCTVRIIGAGSAYDTHYAGCILKAGNEYVADVVGGGSCTRYNSLKEASDYIKEAIGRVLEIDGLCSEAVLVESSKDFDYAASTYVDHFYKGE